jgi:RNA polymerase sigma-32 factor
MINWENADVLSSEEQLDLARKVHHGDQNARTRLVECNARLVAKIAHNYRDFENKWKEDLFQAGMMGLCVAVNRFDPNKGVKFITYAAWWIRQAILRHLIDNFRLVRIGKTGAQRKLFWRLRREQRKLSAEGVSYGAQDVADALGVAESDVEDMESILGASETTLSAPVGDGLTLADTLEDSKDMAADVEGAAMHGWLYDRMIEFEQRLSARDMVIWNKRVAASVPQTHDEISQVVGLTRQRVQQIEAKIRERFVRYARQRAIA